MKLIVNIREAYITYKNGTPCGFYEVPCDCDCHKKGRPPKAPSECVHCKAVHDMKKKFK